MSKKPVDENKDLAVKEEAGALSAIDFEEDAGAGFEDAGREAYAIPFLRILQSNSPQCKKLDPRYIQGAEEGDLINTVTEKIYKEGVLFVPCYYRQAFNLWAPNRGGFRGSLTPMEYADTPTHQKEIRGDDGKPKRVEVTDDGLVVDDTREHYGIVVDRDAIIPVLICMNSSQIKKSKKWMTLMDGIRLPSHKPAPMFSQIYKISTVGESNDQGSWAGFKVEHYRPVQNKAIYDAAKTFREMIRSGSAKPQDIDDNF